MGVVKRLGTNELIALRAETSVGRSPQCTVRLTDSLVSSIHASIRWTPDGWEVKDLGSTNGTYVNAARLNAGQVKALLVGHRVCFGASTNGIELVEDSPPGLLAMASDGETVLAETGVLTIPVSGDPQACIFRGTDGVWQLELRDSAGPAHDGQRFDAAGKTWTLTFSDDVARTSGALNQQDLRMSRLVFEVAPDEEAVELTVVLGDTCFSVGTRASNYLLLTLARQRCKDRLAGIVEKDCGWVYAQELARGLRVPPEHINVDIFRARRRLSDFFLHSGEIIQRRIGAGQLRIGIRDLEIVVRPGI